MEPNRRVLVVEDDPGLREFYREVLDGGLQVVTADDGPTAIAAVEEALADERPFCGGFFDLVLPGTPDGVATMRRIRELDPRLYFCVVSGAAASTVDRLDPVFDGSPDAWEFLEKPAAVAEIRRRAESMSARWNHGRLRERQGERQDVLAGLGMLAAGLAHEINGPLAFVHANLVTLRRYTGRLQDAHAAYRAFEASVAGLDGAEEATETLRRACRDARVEELMRDLDDLVEESADGAQLVCEISRAMKALSPTEGALSEAANLNDCVRRALLLGRHEIKRRAEVETDLADLPPTRCNGAELTQVVLNLVVNAAQAIETHGTIRIRTSMTDGRILLEVADDGCGMPDEVRERIFDPFFTTKPPGIGSGLGMMLVRDIVDKHGGSIDCETAAGEGTTFRVRLEPDRGEEAP